MGSDRTVGLVDDLVAVRADDALLDALDRGTGAGAAGGPDAELLALLAAWRAGPGRDTATEVARPQPR